MGKFSAMALPLGVPAFRRVWLGQVANVFGDAAYGVAIALYLLPRDDAARALGLVLGLAALGGVVSLLVGGLLADRYSRARVIIASDLVRAGALGGILLAGADAPLWLLGVCAAVLGIGTGIYRPSYQSILPTLVPKEMLPGANALRALVNRFVSVGGAALAGVLAVATTPRTVLVIDLCTFLASIATLTGLTRQTATPDTSSASVFTRLAGGFAYVGTRPWMSAILLQGTVQMAFVAAPVTLCLPLLIGHDGFWYGMVVAAEAAGAVIGATVAAGLKARSPGWAAMTALLCQLPQTVCIAAGTAPWLLAVTSALAGVGLAVFGVIWTTALQSEVPREKLGRVFALDSLATNGLTPLGYIVAGALLPLTGASVLAWIAAGVLATSVLVVLPIPGVRRLTDPVPREAEATVGLGAK
jgi:MFS family permease